jgi:Na+/H+ antiporter NhaC
MQAFVSSVPMNLYAILSLFMIVWLSVKPKSDFGPMAMAQLRSERGQVQSAGSEEMSDELARMNVSDNGKVLDLIIPVVFLVIVSILAMLFYGGFLDMEGSLGERIFEAFGETDAGMALALGGIISLVAAFFLFVPRKLMNLSEFFSSVTAGIKSMVPALIILALAWTISGVCRDLLSTGPYVASLVERSNLPVILIPAIMFIIAAALSFATGTSWGTFGILIPITITVCDTIIESDTIVVSNNVASWLSITSLSAVLAGSVFGDHCSPISDTTILSSTGAQCRHIDHVATQIPYALTVAAVCFIGYIIAGITSGLGYAVSVGVTLPVSLALLIAALIVLPKVLKSTAKG